ncbi:MAG TPA: hypothetical protein VLM41_08565 [Steroidobacteraceae bacterium]|nr:hypothetical protein [Steroidobacteraceae bacterium]
MNEDANAGEIWVVLPWLADAFETRGGDGAAPALKWLLARGKRPQDGEDDWRSFCVRSVGLPAGTLERFPEGPCARAAWSGSPASGCWARARPVHLLAAIDHLRLAPLEGLQISHAEAGELLQSLNAHLREIGLCLHVASPGEWLLECREPLDCESPDPARAAGENLRHHLPRGVDARRLQGIVNELQMVLHEHPVNVDRAARGLLPINSVWFWGFGQAPAASPQALPMLLSDDPWLRGLWTLHGAACAVLSEAGERIGLGQRLLLVASEPAAFGGGRALETLEREVFAPLRSALRCGAMRRVSLLLGKQTLEINGGMRWRFWRRPGTPVEMPE